MPATSSRLESPALRRAMLKERQVHRRGSRAALVRIANTGPGHAVQRAPAHAPTWSRPACAAGGTPIEFNTIAVRRHHDGHRGYARLAGVARGDRRFDRAVRDVASARRRRRAVGLRQDDPGLRDGARAARRARRDAVRRADGARRVRGQGRHDPGCVRGGRRARRGADVDRAAHRAREPARAPARRVRRPVHGQHDPVAVRCSGSSPMGASEVAPRIQPSTRRAARGDYE